MSYPYDSNPWDDNYDPNATQNTSTSYGGYTEGYSNPVTQYTDTGFADTQQYQYQDQKPTQEQQYTDQSQIKLEQLNQPAPPPPSALRRFLRQHVPLCGPIMDTLSGINLPFIDALVQNINGDLLVSKMFYFFFYSAFGSLFPLMGVYFKQLGMNPAQVGILTGVRPFIEIFSAPFWNSLAERFHKSKALLLFSLLSWIVFTYSLAHIRPPASACVAFNDTDYVLYTPYSANDLSNYEVESSSTDESGRIDSSEENYKNEMFMNRMPPSIIEGRSNHNNNDKEGKDQILAKEENQNDQRKRRRRKRETVQYPSRDKLGHQYSQDPRYTYSVDLKDQAGYDVSNFDVDIDPDSDFDDNPINKDKSDQTYHGSWSFWDPQKEKNTPSEDAGSDHNELERLYPKVDRLKRGIAVKDIDDVLGESDEGEPEEQEPTNIDEEKSGSQEDEKDDEDGRGQVEEGEGFAGKKKDLMTVKSDSRPTKVDSPSKGTVTTQTVSSTTLTPDSATEQYQGKVVNGMTVNKTKRIYKQRHKTPPTHIVGMSPITVEYAVNYNKEKHSQFVTPMFSTIVYKLDDIKEVFFLLLLLISLGEFFSAPALTLADSATLSYLGDNTDLYGRQRMFGSVSWAITLLLVGMALDNATSIADHPCGPHQRERSYTVCFVIFSLLMACAFLTATQFRFNYPKAVSASGGQALVASTTDSSTVVTTTVDESVAGNMDQLYASTQPRSIFNTAPPVNAPPSIIQQDGKEKFEFLDKWKSAVFAQRTWELPEWVNVFRQFSNSLHLMYLFITWFLGCGVGLVFTFLFWHLQDVGGIPTLFGICSVINHISEILAYFFSFSFIKRFGHTRVLSVGLGCNVIRFLYVAFLTDPYYALPFELVQGITHAACFAACCSYMSHVSKPELRTSTQGVMQGLHHGIGRACGALLGGYMINAIGSRASFCIYGLLSGCVLAGFLYVRKKASESADEEVKVDDSEALGGYGAPQGVPSTIPGKIGGQIASTGQDYEW